jgi:microcompartment protein CcmK/EutM
MKAGHVIGTVTLSQAAPQFRGASWKVVAPMGPDQLAGRPGRDYGSAPTPVVLDALGAGTGDPVLYVEGAEATQPFPEPIPLDAITVALLDRYEFDPLP